MSYIERGLYRELLDECWSEGLIPNSIEDMAEICGCPVDVMANAWQVLSKCFIEIDGGLINERLNKERTAKDIDRVNKAIAGRKGGLSKLLKEKENEASAKQVLSKCHIEEKRREEKSIGIHTSSDDDKTVKIDYQAIVDLFNTVLPELPSVKILTDKRKSSIRSCALVKPRFSEIGFWEVYFQEVRKSDFLMGRKTDWKADFDFLTTRSKFVKVVEGAY
jgi:uncharacterized protein YdaU (DUF1376 family)